MKNFIKFLLVFMFLLIPIKVFGTEVTNVITDEDSKLSFTGIEGYDVYQVTIKSGDTVLDTFGHNCNGKTANLAVKIVVGCEANSGACDEDYVGNYTLEITALDTANGYAEVEGSKTTKTLAFKTAENNGDGYNHVDVVGNETKYRIIVDPNDGETTPTTYSNLHFGDDFELKDYEYYGIIVPENKYPAGYSTNITKVVQSVTVYPEYENLYTINLDFNGGLWNMQTSRSYQTVSVGIGWDYDLLMVGNVYNENPEDDIAVIPPSGKELDYITVNDVRVEDGDPVEWGDVIVKNVKYHWKWSEGTTVRTVTLMDGFGNLVDTVEVEDGRYFNIPEDPEMGGLTFNCWMDGDECYVFENPVTQDITLEAAWYFNFLVGANLDNVAMFTYLGADYENAIGSSGDYHDGEIIGIDQQGINGYSLKEWRLGSETGPIIGTDSSADYYIAEGGHLKIKQKPETANLHFIAIYEKTTYAVNFVTNGGTPINTQYVEPGAYAARPDLHASNKEGYLLGKWYTDQGLTQEYNFSTSVENDMTLYASWDIYLTEVRGTVNKPVDGFTADTNIVSAEENKYTFDFQCWYLTSDGYPYIEGNATFEKDKEYEIRYYVVPAEGYAVDYQTHFYLNDEETSCYGAAEARQIRWVATDPVTVTEFNIGGIVRPYEGKAPEVNNIKFNDDGLKILGAFWTAEDTGEELTSSSKFVYGKRYILHIRFNPTYGHLLADGFNEDVITGVDGYLKAEYIDNFDESEMQIFFEATKPPKIIVAPTVRLVKGNNNSIIVNWNEVEFAEKYEVYRSENGKKWTKIGTVTNNTFTSTGLVYGKKYYYLVRAINTVGYKQSAIVSGKTIPNKVANVRVTAVGQKNIRIYWDKTDATGYEVYMGNKKVATIKKNSTITYNKTKLKVNTVYSFKVRAYKTVGGKKVYGAFSNVVTTRTTPYAPSVSLYVTNYDTMKLGVGTVKGVSKYEVQESADGKTYTAFETFTAGKTLTLPGHEIGKTYYFRVRTCNNYNKCSGWVYRSKKQSTKTPAISLSTTSKNVKVTFTKVDEADGYEIIRSTYKNKKYTLIKTVLTAEDMPVTFNNATKKRKTYYYKIRSFKVVDGKKVYSDYSGYKKIKSK